MKRKTIANVDGLGCGENEIIDLNQCTFSNKILGYSHLLDLYPCTKIDTMFLCSFLLPPSHTFQAFFYQPC